MLGPRLLTVLVFIISTLVCGFAALSFYHLDVQATSREAVHPLIVFSVVGLPLGYVFARLFYAARSR